MRSFTTTHDRFGHTFFPVTETDDCKVLIELTYDKELKIRNYYINRFLVDGDTVSTLADCYDNEQMERDILDYELQDAEIRRFQLDHRPDTPQRIAG